MKRCIYIAAAVIVAAMVATIGIQSVKLKSLAAERDRYQHNTNALLSDVYAYKVRDSLNAAKVGTLTLTLREYERFRAEDATLIGSLRADKQTLQSVTTTQMRTITELQNLPIRDSVIHRAGRVDTVRYMEYHDKWLDFIGCQNDSVGAASIASREELLISTHIEYKRWLGFLWRTKKIKSQDTDAVSKNPRTEIVDLEHVIITK